MYGVVGLERSRKSQSLEPFSATPIASPEKAVYPSVSPVHLQASQQQTQFKKPDSVPQTPIGPEIVAPVASGSIAAQVGWGQSTWQPPDWAVEPQTSGAYYLEVLKDNEVIGQINLDKRRHIFGKLFPMCDFVLNHESISHQHAAVVTHENGSVYVIDLGSANGTFVSNERVTKDNPIELKVGQYLRFAASTRTYILRENVKASDDLNNEESERAGKRIRKARVTFRDETEVIGISDGADVETEISPAGVLSLLGEYESLVETTLIPRGKEHASSVENSNNHKGVTDKLQEVFDKVKSAPKTGGIYGELYGGSCSVEVGSSWAQAPISSGDKQVAQKSNEKPGNGGGDDNGEHDELFGD